MMYEELKNIDTQNLLVKVSDYVGLARKYLHEEDKGMAEKILSELEFFVDYHQHVNLKDPADYDEDSLSYIKAWNEQNNIK